MMLHLILAALFSTPSFAISISDPQLVRILDGHAVPCLEPWEAGRDSFTPTVRELGLDGEQARLVVELSFVRCVREGNAVSLRPRRPLDPLLGMDAEGAPVRTEFRSPELLFTNADFARGLAAPVANELSTSVEYRFDPLALLTAEQRAAFERGQPVRARTGLLYRALGTVFSARGEVPLGTIFGGSYTLFFILKK